MERETSTIEKQIANVFGLDDEAWARHANKWSVWTRFTAMPLLSFAAWSRVWLGYWSLALVAAVIFWIWINPRIFAKPESTNNWASRAVLGERIWMNRNKVPVPSHHLTAPNLVNLAGIVGAGFLAWGLYVLHLPTTVLACAVIILSKLWFLDRMNWLYEEMKDSDPAYQSWLY